jgi:hypothetical protein
VAADLEQMFTGLVPNGHPGRGQLNTSTHAGATGVTMNHSMSFKHLAVALGIVAMAVLVLTSFGIPLATLVPLAAVALCPLMMIVMMVMMTRSNGQEDRSSHDHGSMRP